jgi:hypothetical protein
MQRFFIIGTIMLLVAAIKATSFVSTAISTDPTNAYCTPSDFLPQKLGSFSSCSNGTNAMSGTASDIAILAALLETNVTQELAQQNLSRPL